MRNIILASQSPRRRELLQQIGLEFTVIASHIDESKLAIDSPSELAMALAYQKGQAIADQFKDSNSLIISADTLVVCEGKILNKPSSDADAYEKLSLLNGKFHEVLTGLCVIDLPVNTSYCDYESTRVYFRNLNEQEIRAYVAKQEGRDKAGAYGIQGLGALLIDRIEGSYSNVVGLPLTNLYLLLRKCGLDILGGA